MQIGCKQQDTGDMFECEFEEDDEDLLDGLKTPPENESGFNNIQSI